MGNVALFFFAVVVLFLIGFFLGRFFSPSTKDSVFKEKLYEEEKLKHQETQKKFNEAQEQLNKAKDELNSLNISKEVLESQKRDLELQKESQRKESENVLQRQNEYFEKIHKEIENKFSAIASQVLDRQKADLADKSKSILEPLKSDIAAFKESVNNLRKEEIESHTALKTEVVKEMQTAQSLNQIIAQEAKNLSTALQNKKIQGNWGEMVLERVLESAGFREGEHFSKQQFFNNEESPNQIPDFIINLPKDRRVIIDCKTSMENYKNWANESDEVAKGIFLKKHRDDLKRHIDNLSEKEYQKLLKENGLDFVLMFI
ncbi:MAG: DNA recombination protein RmuC, partial [Elusimicrobiota bacterium]|nr:DNA recombination protein RmuC [Elusimicrobiota bacterium]